MPWWFWLGSSLYVLGWVGFVIQQEPTDALDGAISIYCGILWPLFALGWLVSRR